MGADLFLCDLYMTWLIDCIWGLTTCQPLWVILCRLPETGRKRDRRFSKRDEKEEQERKRNWNESEETEEIKIFPPLILPATRIAGLAQL